MNGIKRTVQVGQLHNFTVNKNKTGASQYSEGDFVYYSRKHKHYRAFEVNNDEAAFRMALYYDLLKDNGKALVAGGVLLPRKKDLAVKALHDNPKMLQALYRLVIQAIQAEAAAAYDDDEDEEDDEEDDDETPAQKASIMVAPSAKKKVVR